MKIKILAAVIVVVGLVVAGLGLYNFVFAEQPYFEDDFSTDDGNIVGTWRVTPQMVTMDNEVVDMKEEQGGLVVKYDNSPVKYIQYNVSVKFTQKFSNIKSSFNDVKMVLQDHKMITTAEPNFLIVNPIFNDIPVYGFINFENGKSEKTFDFGSFQHVYTFQVPVDVEGVGNGTSNPPSVWLYPSDMDAMMSGAEEGMWTFTFDPQGVIKIQGLNDEYGDGDLKSVDVPGMLSTTVSVKHNKVSVDWDAEIDYVYE